MTVWIIKHVTKMLLGLVAIVAVIGLLYGLIALTDGSLCGTVVEIENPHHITVRLRPLSAYFWFDRLLNGGERLDEVVLIYNGDGRFKVGDRVYAYTFGVTRLTPEDNRTNALFILKIF